MTTQKIIYTMVDEAPALATYSLLPIIQAFTKAADISVETRDISLAGRILSHFPENLSADQKISDNLSELGKLALKPEANIIKLPNISASLPQLKAAIKELQSQGFEIPDYPETPETDSDKEVGVRYDKILGSAVNPVLREGNSDRRAAASVKQFARNNPHKMGVWSATSKTHVAHMSTNDFYGSEKSVTVTEAGNVLIEFVNGNSQTTILKKNIILQAGEIIDASTMSRRTLRVFFEEQMEDAKKQGVLLSLHLKATMMKISDPIMFGHAVSVYYKDVLEKHATIIAELGVNINNGLGDLYTKIAKLPEARQAEIKADINAVYKVRPELAMVNSDKGITNLHVPSDIIVDASMPAMIRDSGGMWGPDGKLKDTKAIIPDRCYARIYQTVIDFCKQNGAFDVTTMGNVSNVGLMAQKAEEYGSHDKTFEIPHAGTVQVVDAEGTTLLEQTVNTGDIWRMCQTKDEPIKDWVRLAVSRARATGSTTIFWLDSDRAHDNNLIAKVNEYLPLHDTTGLDIQILSTTAAMQLTCERCRDGLDTVSVTGNVLRDYLTDLFPIIELGTSAKMLSIVPLLAGGGLYETGAGGSAPKHVQQFQAENHLRWDSLGEFLAIGVSLEELAEKTANKKLELVAAALNQASSQYLTENRSPSRKVNELDNRGSHFYLALYWAQALATQTDCSELQAEFSVLATTLSNNEQVIVDQLIAVQGEAVDLGGYYHPCEQSVVTAMRPSTIFNDAIDGFSGDGNEH